MPLVTVTNKTSSRLPVGSYIGTLNANEVRRVTLTGNELELSRKVLVDLSSRGLITWDIDSSAGDDDNLTEIVFGGARVISGTGSPNNSIKGRVGDLYVNRAGGANSTLYVKESGNDTNTGWVAK